MCFIFAFLTGWSRQSSVEEGDDTHFLASEFSNVLNNLNLMTAVNIAAYAASTVDQIWGQFFTIIDFDYGFDLTNCQTSDIFLNSSVAQSSFILDYLK